MKQFRIFLLVVVIYVLGVVHGLTLRTETRGSTPSWLEVKGFPKPQPLEFSICPMCHRPILQDTNRLWHGARDNDWEPK